MELALKLASIFFTMILVDNYVLAKFLGICPFLGVSKKLDSAVGMSLAVTFVMVLATAEADFGFLAPMLGAQTGGFDGIDVGTGNGLDPAMGFGAGYAMCAPEARDWQRSKLVLTVGSNYCESSLPNVFTFFDAKEAGAHMVTVDPITQITIYQQEQTTLLHSLAQDLTGSFTDRVGAAIDMAVQPMQQSLDRFVTATTQKQLEGLDIIVNRFVRSMNDSLQGQFNNLAKTIDETCRWHEDTQETVQATIEGLNRVSRDIVQIQQMSESLITKFDKYMNRLGAAQHQIDEGFSVVSSGVKDMEMVARQQASYVSQIGQMQADFMREVTSFQTRMDQFTRTFTESANTSASAMMKVSAELKHNGEALTTSHKAFTDGVNEELNHAFGMFDANMQDIIDDLTNVINSIKASVDTMPQTLNQTARQFSEQMRQLTGYLQDSQERMDDALRRANGASRRNGGV